ncbi:MAG: LLM class flavin-dependent oxidoreductase, partial [Nocardiopsaceae bacterium]|nr:LLM class flavin-dependent oxidoreductase [Nocardiopsaceae bacterium]
TLDYVGRGRAGVRVQVSPRAQEAAHLGRRTFPAFRLDGGPLPPEFADAFEEAADYVEVLRRLWDSWEDDAEIRDVATGRFVDRDKLHYIDFEGRWFSVRGPSVTPRPPQGQPVVAALGHSMALGHGSVPFRLIARSADIGFVTPGDRDQAAEIVSEIRALQTEAWRDDETIPVFADLVVFLDDDAPAARARRERLDERAGTAYASDALIFTGTPAALADLLLDWRQAGLAGFRLRPAALPHDLLQITGSLVPVLQRRDSFRTSYPETRATLRGLLGLPRPASRYARA